eukprot:CAMPEP_0202892582 /NCGR_PEP_ID=MMETSP1392-20130828/2297_1 /ASSEMBLY_ACC=CAM_ASM_000868 /TAXON_ID=225041 /ORGANISM="Chlamydomonas chlamydogama, Strain SAG 11-48b" /LENGTH=384 /DNA_ID=CAMNT_0049576591 /DNA_START=135 /DNA_END=1289 /DNA_ORIENTATION=-
MTREREDFFEHLRKPQRPKGFNRQAQVKALKESVQSGHKTGLPPKLLDLFAPRQQLQPGTAIKKRKPKLPYSGVADYVKFFANPGDQEYEPPPPSNRPPSPRLCRNRELPVQARIDTETAIEKKNRITEWKKEEAQNQVMESLKSWEPNKDPKVQGDPYKTIFVARLAFDVNEKKLRREFEEFGPIKNIRIIHDKSGKHRGYAFVEFEHKKDMKEAYKQADGRKIEGRRIVVDVERGRTVENWRPRRLGGGLGGTGREPKPPKKAVPGMPAPTMDDDRRGPAPMDYSRAPPRDDYRGGPPRDSRPRSPPRERPRDDFRDRDRDRERDRDRDRERDRERDRDRKRDRDASPRRDRDDDTKRRHLEDGEVRDRNRDSGRRRERDML